jgi:hypothetical protein
MASGVPLVTNIVVEVVSSNGNLLSDMVWVKKLTDHGASREMKLGMIFFVGSGQQRVWRTLQAAAKRRGLMGEEVVRIPNRGEETIRTRLVWRVKR